MSVVEIEYYTDPLCSWSWAFEPHWRRLRLEFAGRLRWRYRLGGMLASWDQYNDPINAVTRPVQMGPQWYQVRVLTGMPIEDRIWFEDPPASSYPACLAVKAAQRQGPEAGERCLRRLREAVMLERRNIAHRSVLLEVAAELAATTPAFDAGQFAHDLDSPATWDALKDDLKEAAWLRIDRFPTLLLRTTGPATSPGETLVLTGFRPYAALLPALTRLAPQVEPHPWRGDPAAFVAAWGSATACEVAETLSTAAAAAEGALAAAVAGNRLAQRGELFTSISPGLDAAGGSPIPVPTT